MADIVTSKSLVEGSLPLEGFRGFTSVQTGSGGRTTDLSATGFTYFSGGQQAYGSSVRGEGFGLTYHDELLAGGFVNTIGIASNGGGFRGNPFATSSTTYYGINANVQQIASSTFWDALLNGDDTVLVNFVEADGPLTIQTGAGNDRVIEGTAGPIGDARKNPAHLPNRIDLGAGDDVLEVSGTATPLVVTLGSGSDTIRQALDAGSLTGQPLRVSDFNLAEDRIEFAGSHVSNIVLLQSGADTIVAQGTSSIDGTNLLILENVQASTLAVAGGVISGNGHPAGPIIGTAGDDILTGTQARDIIDGRGGDDTIFALAGDDLVYGRQGNDTIDGGAGADRLFGGFGNDTIFAGLGNDEISGSFGFDTLYGGAGNDAIDAGQQDDVVFGGEGHDAILGGGGDDTLFGENGDDAIDGGLGDDAIDGGFGNDTLFGGFGDDTIFGGAGDDTVIAGAGHDRVVGNGGRDVLRGHGGDDSIDGGLGNDIVFGDGGDDKLYGSRGNDQLYGGIGDDVLFGGIGNDRLEGEAGNDVVRGGGGWDRIGGGAGDDILFGEDGHDKLYGGDGTDVLRGGAHNDGLFGGAGDDQLFGGDGIDFLEGGAGNDLLDGGAGRDIFRFDYGFGLDVLYGFTSGEDRLALAPGVTAEAFLTNTVETRQGLVFDAGNGNVLSLLGVTFDTFDAHTDLILA